MLPANDEAAVESTPGSLRADGPAAAGLGNLLAIAEAQRAFGRRLLNAGKRRRSFLGGQVAGADNNKGDHSSQNPWF
jgi:hypothetical protein